MNNIQMNKIPLKSGYTLSYDDHTYTIKGVLGTGASCIAYLSERSDSPGNNPPSLCVLKEFYPGNSANNIMITRAESGGLLYAPDDPKNEKYFSERMAKFLSSGALQAKLRASERFTNQTPPVNFSFEANGTAYLDVTRFVGEPFSALGGLSTRDKIKVCLSVSRLVSGYHRSGYLCLDIKPDNILVLPETFELVEFIDFDSVIEISDAGERAASFTREWAAPEQITGGRITEAADIYALGELVFYSIFGRHSTEKEHCLFSGYPFDDNKIFGSFTVRKICREIFSRTLRTSAENRFRSAEMLVERLEKLLAELEKSVRIISANAMENVYFTGREQELSTVSEILGYKKIAFITGVGGIGKSSLAREYIRRNSELFDNVIFLNYKSSIKNTIANDYGFRIENVSRSPEETLSDYFARKLAIASELVSGTKSLLVLDNFEGELDEDFAEISRIDWKILVVTREYKFSRDYPTVNVGALDNEIIDLFEHYSELEFTTTDRETAEKIIRKTAGHTLTVKLIARQIAHSCLTLETAVELIESVGFSNYSSDRVELVKDDRSYNDTILNIISALFTNERLTVGERAVIGLTSLFGTSGININLFREMLKSTVSNSDIIRLISGLEGRGWIVVCGNSVVVHPVIAEAARCWEQTGIFFSAADDLIVKVSSAIRSAAKRFDFKNLLYFLGIAESIISYSLSYPALEALKSYPRLLYAAVMNMPQEREELMILYSERLLGISHKAETGGRSSVMKLYDRLIFVLLEKGDISAARERLSEARDYARKAGRDELWACFYDSLTTYYDYLIDGNYYARTDEQKRIYKKLDDAVDKAIRYAWRGNSDYCTDCLVRHVLSKSGILIRAFPERKEEIDALMSEADMLVKKYCNEYSKEASALKLNKAWYYTYVEFDCCKAVDYIKKADGTAERVYDNALAMIKEHYIPTANILFECGEFELSARQLEAALRICEEKWEMLPYQRTGKEILDHLSEVNKYITPR